MENRGRPKEQEAIPWQKYTQEMLEVPSKPELGSRSVWHYDRSINDKGPWKTEYFEAKGTKRSKTKFDKKPYGKTPVVLVFKTSNRSNAKVKMKVWRNTNIDYIASADKLPGVPDTSIILECGVGQSCIDSYKLKYNL